MEYISFKIVKKLRRTSSTGPSTLPRVMLVLLDLNVCFAGFKRDFDLSRLADQVMKMSAGCSRSRFSCCANRAAS